MSQEGQWDICKACSRHRPYIPEGARETPSLVVNLGMVFEGCSSDCVCSGRHAEEHLGVCRPNPSLTGLPGRASVCVWMGMKSYGKSIVHPGIVYRVCVAQSRSSINASGIIGLNVSWTKIYLLYQRPIHSPGQERIE